MEVGFVGKKGKKGKGKQQQSKGWRQAEQGQRTSRTRNQPKAHGRKKAMGKPEQSKQSSGRFQGYCGQTAASGATSSASAGESRSTIWQTVPRPAAARGWTLTTAPANTAQAQVKVVSLANLWEQDEVDDKRWLFSVGMAGWPSGLQGRPGQWCTILIDSGSSATVCGPQHFPESPIVPSESLSLYEPSGKPLMHYGQKEVSFVAEDGQNVQTSSSTSANVVRPIVNVGKLQQGGKEGRSGQEELHQGASRTAWCKTAWAVSRSRHSFSSGSKSQRGADTGTSFGENNSGDHRLRTKCGAVEGPEVTGMPIEEPEHQVDVFKQ